MERTLSDIPCIVLAGGKGTRLRSVVKDLPKPMALIGDTPFLIILLNHLHQKGVNEFIISVGYKKFVIIDYIKSNNYPYTISFSEEDEALGTGGAISQALQHINSDYVLAVNGDTFFDIDLLDFVNQSMKMDFACSIALHRIKQGNRYGEVIIGDNSIIKFTEKKTVSNGLINGGIYLLNKTKFTQKSLGTSFSFETDYLEKYVNEGEFIGFEQKGYFIDIGIPEDYRKAQNELI